MNKQELINQIIAIIGDNDIYDGKRSTYERTYDVCPEDLIEERTSFIDMIYYANEMMYKIMEVRDLILKENY